MFGDAAGASGVRTGASANAEEVLAGRLGVSGEWVLDESCVPDGEELVGLSERGADGVSASALVPTWGSECGVDGVPTSVLAPLGASELRAFGSSERGAESGEPDSRAEFGLES